MPVVLAERVKRVKPSPTVALNGRVVRLRAEGRDIIGLGVGEPSGGVDRRELAEGERGPHRGGQVWEVEVPDVAEAEGLRHGERPVPEPRIRRQELHSHAIAGERPERQRCFECRHAAACDEHVPPVVGHRRSSSVELRLV